MKKNLSSEVATKLVVALLIYLPFSALLFFLSYMGFVTSNADMAVIGFCLGAFLLHIGLTGLWRAWQWHRKRHL